MEVGNSLIYVVLAVLGEPEDIGSGQLQTFSRFGRQPSGVKRPYPLAMVGLGAPGGQLLIQPAVSLLGNVISPGNAELGVVSGRAISICVAHRLLLVRLVA
jgi:hypothetical protein